MDAGELRARLAEHASALGIPGASVGVLLDGVLTTACHGVADVRTNAPIDGASRFSTGSLTKSMVAAAVARLAAQRRLGLHDPIADHVPELAGVPWARRSTVEDLLANRSGLPLRAGLEFDFDVTDATDAALSHFAARVAAEAPTRVRWSYSNTGYTLLGRAIETVTGRVWEDAMNAELLAPAGMTSTVFALEAGTPGRVVGHAVGPAGAIPVEPLITRQLGPAGTTMVSTIDDLLAFARLLLEDPALAVLREPGADVGIAGWLDGWCHGLARFDWGGAAVWGWDSLIDGERGVLRIVPERHGAVVLLSNSDAGRRLYRALLPGLMRSIFDVDMPPLALGPSIAGPSNVAPASGSRELMRYAGVYGWADRRIEVRVSGSELVISRDGTEQVAQPIDHATFLVDPDDPDTPTVTFGEVGADGRPTVLYEMIWGLPRLSE